MGERIPFGLLHSVSARFQMAIDTTMEDRNMEQESVFSNGSGDDDDD